MRSLSLQSPIELLSVKYHVPLAETTIDFIYFPTEDQNEENKKFLLIIPGLTGSINEAYIRELCEEALKNGFRPIVLTNRWLAKPLKLPKTGPINFTDDLKITIDYIVERYQIKEIYGIGISYGSNMLCKFLGTVGMNSGVFKGAVSIGNPFDMDKNKDIINRFWNLILCKILQKALKEREKIFGKKKFNLIDINEALKGNNFINFDEFFTRRMLGYSSVNEYYQKISCVNDLKNIAVPLLFLQSKDDPICHHEVIPFIEAEKNRNLIFYTTERGGHIGWIEEVFSLKVFYPKPCIQFLKSVANF